ncbi:VOC family protein [Henriciella aquimarina]|uniref:VOC family protein n=1 Tax=Henriciella aquimarina TaxID=545261 RepID=UPI000A00ABC3|nr:VOC family protein [Henriciella aquimarina]
MLKGHPIRQIAYVVDDIEAAARRHHDLFGSGPFFVAEDITVPVTHRGKEIEFSHKAAFGQCGQTQIELMKPLTSGPSIIHDLYPDGSGKGGIHHMAIIVDDIDATISKADAEGFPAVLRAYMAEMDMKTAFLDSVTTYGHFIELYETCPSILDFYDMIEKAAEGFDGTSLFRELSF